MRAYIRRFPVVVLTAVLLASCGDDDGPSGPEIGLPESLAPVSVTTPKNTAIEATISVASIEGRNLSYTVLSGPSNGTVDLTELSTGVRVRYTPTTGFAGQDRVTYRVADGVSTVDGEVNITVTNAPPSAENVTVRRPATQPVTFEVSGTDPDGDALTFEVVDGPDGGSLSGFSAAGPSAGPAAQSPATTTAQVTYTPDEGFLGDETFTYRATDGDDASAPATVTLTANRLPQVVVEDGLPVPVQRNQPTRIDLVLTDADNDDVTATLAAAPTHGTLGDLEPTQDGYDVLYTPDAGYAGDDAFTLLVDDGLDVVAFEVTITVVNRAPVAFNASQVGFVGADVVLTLTGADPDGDPLAFEIVTAPAVGTLGTPTATSATTGQVTYSPGAATEGVQTFTFRVTDGLSFSDPATFTIQLQSERPVAQEVNVTTTEDTSIDITLTGIDQQGDPLTFAVASGVSHGTLGAITNLGPFTAQVTYTPDPNYSGFDLFTFTVSDGTRTSTPATVGINVIPADDPPIVVASPVEAFTTHTNVPLQVAATRTLTPGVFVVGDLLSNFTDPDGDGLSISLEAGTVTAGASVTLAADGTFTYTPPIGRTVDDTFDYTVTDGTTPVTRTVTISFDTPIWFVDDTFGGTADGSAAAPFTSLGAAAGAAGPGDIVFVYTGNSGATPLGGGFAFQAGQQLVGEPSGLTTARGTIVAAAAGPRPTVTNAAGAGITLADGALLRGIDVTGTSGAGIFASGVTGATVDAVTVSGTTGPGIDLDAPAGAWSFTSVVITGAAGAAFDVDGGSATITTDAAITNTAGRSIEISAVTGGSIAHSGTISDTGAGLQVDNNTGGTFTFSGTSKTLNTAANPGVTLLNNTGATVAFTGGGLDIDVTTAAGFSATGGGTVTVTGTGNSVLATTGTPVTITNTTIGGAGVTFERIDANGAASGIVLDATGAGAFTVTGVGTTDGSGGTITNTTGAGASFNQTAAVTLANVVLGDGTAVAGQAPDAVNAVGGSGIVATDVSGSPGLTLTNVRVARTAGHGLDATRLTGLSISASEFLNVGDGPGDNALNFGASGGPDGLFGTATVTNTVLDGFVGSGVRLDNASGSVGLTVSGGTIGNNQTGIAAGVGQDGVAVVAAGTAAVRVAVTGNVAMAGLEGRAVFGSGVASSSLDLTVSNASINDANSTAGAVTVTADASSGVRAAVDNVTILAAGGSGVFFQETGAATLDGSVNNIVVGTSGSVNSGAETGNGITMVHGGTGISRFQASNNTLHSHQGAGIFSLNVETGAAADVDSHVIVTGNTVAAPEDAAALGGIQVLTDADHTLCTDITGNTSAGSAGATGIEVQQSNASTFGVVGLGAMAIDAYLASVNTATAASIGGAYVDAGVGSCSAPTPPTSP